MGVLTNAREMSGSTRIKRGAGLLLLAVVLFALDVAVIYLTEEAAGPASSAAVLGVLVGVAFGLAGLACVVVGVGLILWGLLRD